MADERVLAITDPKDRELTRFSVGESFDAKSRSWKPLFPAPKAQARATRISCAGFGGCAPFARQQKVVPLPPTCPPRR